MSEIPRSTLRVLGTATAGGALAEAATVAGGLALFVAILFNAPPKIDQDLATF